ncbi:MAG: hypothetical protein ABI700_01310 [Chloroflexota bacterium]
MARLIKVCAALAVILSIGQFAVLNSARQTFNDPFAPVAALLAGQPLTSPPPCDLHPHSEGAPPTIHNEGVSYCAVYLAEGAFASVSAYTHLGKFARTTLYVTQDLVVGDILLRWGRPDVILKGEHSFYLRWTKQGLYALITPRGAMRDFSYPLSIASLTIGLLRDTAVIP